jgi:hypothetical protein
MTHLPQCPARKLFDIVIDLTTTSTAEDCCVQLLWPLLSRGQQLISIVYYVSGNENLEILVSSLLDSLGHPTRLSPHSNNCQIPFSPEITVSLQLLNSIRSCSQYGQLVQILRRERQEKATEVYCVMGSFMFHTPRQTF